MEAALDQNGKADLSKVFDVPKESDTKSQETILKILEEKNEITEEQLYKKEYHLKVAHQILINGGSTGAIAQKLSISPAEARKLKNELSARLINEVKALDKNKVAGQALMFYDHIMAKGLQMVAKEEKNPKGSLRNQVEALKVTLQAQTDKQKFLQMAGFWNNPLSQGMNNYDTAISGANELRDLMTSVISGDEIEINTDDDDYDGIDLI